MINMRGNTAMTKLTLFKTQVKKYFHIKITYDEQYDYLTWKFGNNHFSLPKGDKNGY